MSSILTNSSAMVALNTLKGINKNLNSVQDQISTGLRVGSAKDNSSSWSIATTMKSDVSSFKKVSENLASSNSMLTVARTAAETIADLLTQVKDKVVQGQDPSADTDALQAEVDALTSQITTVAQAAQFNGVNLVKATPDTATIVTAINRDGSGALTDQTMAVTGVDLEALGGTGVYTVGTDNADAVETNLQTAIEAAATFGAAQMRIEKQMEFMDKLATALSDGAGTLVDANMEEASARLTALQTQQQLGIQALTIANQAPQNILSLFR